MNKNLTLQNIQIELKAGRRFKEWIKEKAKKTKGEVVMIILQNNRIALITKEFYPKGIYRIPSGGIKLNETPNEALNREIYEETGIRNPKSKLLATIEWKINQINYKSYVYLIQDAEIKGPTNSMERISKIILVEPEKVLDYLNPRASAEWRDWIKFRRIEAEQCMKLLNIFIGKT